MRSGILCFHPTGRSISDLAPICFNFFLFPFSNSCKQFLTMILAVWKFYTTTGYVSLGPSVLFCSVALKVLNITGFRKALKKFEKVTKVCLSTCHCKSLSHLETDPVSEPVHDGKGPSLDIKSAIYSECSNCQVDKSAFASDKAVTYMLKEMEDLFANSFGTFLYGL